jgi:hypothetical protein
VGRRTARQEEARSGGEGGTEEEEEPVASRERARPGPSARRARS